MTIKIIIPEDEFADSVYNTREWEQSVVIVRWEHDFENHKYTIDYKEN